MMIDWPDYLIVGSGLTGAVMARTLHDAGYRVLVVERRNHVGGNVHDHVHPSGIRIHTYGPHYFRTNSQEIWGFVNRFAEFYTYEPALKSYVDGQFENWPIAANYIRRTVGENWQPEFVGVPQNFEEACLAMMPRLIYEKFVKGYTEKQWGVPACELSVELAGRFDVREDDEPRLKRHKYQGIPAEGYVKFMQNILAGIPIMLNVDYLEDRDIFQPRQKTIFTGPIDAFFGFDLGHLMYRGQERSHEYLANTDFVQPCGQVNNPDPQNGPHIRTLEWKHMMPAAYTNQIRGTVLTKEVTVSPENPELFEYPFPDQQNQDLYQKYRTRADSIEDLLICGRLGEYRYYDMDQAIARALVIVQRMIGKGN